ncbi:MAG: hypothetical protein ACYCVB_12390 [Bacilli bacterium]
MVHIGGVTPESIHLCPTDRCRCDKRCATRHTASWIAQTIPHRLAQPALSDLAPQGASVIKTQTWSQDGHEFAIAVTKWSPTQPTPWMIVAERTKERTWNPLLTAQTQRAFAVQQILVGPRTIAGTAVSVSFIVDAATGLMSHVYTLLVTPSGARIVSDLPGVVAMTALKQIGEMIRIDGLNLQVTESLQGGRWVVRDTPLCHLLSRTSHPVGFVMGWTLVNGKEVKKTSLVEPNVIHVKVGSTLSFVPLNSQAADHMLGGSPESGSFSGISVFAAAPGQPLRFYQAAQIFGNTVSLTSPGRYMYAIVPQNDRTMSPNRETAVLTVQVSK